MQLADYAEYDGLGLAALIKERKTTPRELGQAVLDGIAAVNPKLNAVIEVYADAVETLSDRPGSAPFYGLPTLTKDYPIEAGRPGEFGSVFAKGFRADYDHVFWKKLRAGASPISAAPPRPNSASRRPPSHPSMARRAILGI